MGEENERKTIAQMGGEFLREAAVLVLVFGILDPIISPGAKGQDAGVLSRFSAIELPWVIVVFVATGVLLFFGVLIERKRG